MHGFDETTTMLVYSGSTAASRMLALKETAYYNMQRVRQILIDAQKQSPPPLTTKQKLPINAYFIDRLFPHGNLDVTAAGRVPFELASVGGRCELDETLLEFMLPKFASKLERLQQKTESGGVETTEAKQVC